MKAETAKPAVAAPSFNWLLGQMPLVALVVLCIVASLLSGRFLSGINITNVLMQGAVLTVITIGMTYVIIAGGFDLSVGSVVALSGCVAAMVMVDYGIVPGVLAGILVGTASGLVNGLIVTKLGVNPFITTLATLVLLRGVTMLVTGARQVPIEESLPALFNDFALERLLGLPYMVWLPVLIFAVCHWLLHHTAYGIRLFATGGNRDAAYLAGIPVDRIRTSAYVLCGTLAGVAGVMLASRVQSGQPTAGILYELTAIAAVVLGGAALHGGEGKLYKSVIGVFIIGVVLIAAAAADRLRRR
jgi:ribose transport system permease protein